LIELIQKMLYKKGQKFLFFTAAEFMAALLVTLAVGQINAGKFPTGLFKG
jgi:hypothetical protein